MHKRKRVQSEGIAAPTASGGILHDFPIFSHPHPTLFRNPRRPVVIVGLPLPEDRSKYIWLVPL